MLVNCFLPVLGAQGKRDRTSGQFDEVAVEYAAFICQCRHSSIMEANKHSAERGWRVDVAAKRVECGRRVGIEQRLTQPRLTHDSSSKLGLVVRVVAEAEFIIPGFEVVAEFAQITADTGIEQIVVGRKLKRTGARRELPVA